MLLDHRSNPTVHSREYDEEFLAQTISAPSPQESKIPKMRSHAEILIQILDFVGEDVAALRNLCLACRQMHYIVEPYLYRTVQFYLTADLLDDGRTELFMKSVSTNPTRAAYVQTLRVPFFWKYAKLFPLFVNLRRLQYSTLPNRGHDTPASYPSLASITNLTHLAWWRPVEDPVAFADFLVAQHSLQHLTLIAYNLVSVHERKELILPPNSLMSVRSVTTIDELALQILPGRNIQHLQLYSYNPKSISQNAKVFPSVPGDTRGTSTHL
ncbi:hypothetical protein ONZ45_g3921 [Pleurotus djamor]|nr:hypothetical protein ONZ45_g3921 [Pleurotus djamor]